MMPRLVIFAESSELRQDSDRETERERERSSHAQDLLAFHVEVKISIGKTKSTCDPPRNSNQVGLQSGYPSPLSLLLS
jgi:hypothetical protein